jgi:transposase
MFTLPPALRIYVATEPTDMRKSFDGLSAAVTQLIDEDPTSGHLFVFRNRRGDQVRVLFWDRTGYCIFAKRLAQGRFHLPVAAGSDATCSTASASDSCQERGRWPRGKHRARRAAA